MVASARESFARGDLFEVVPGQTFFEACPRAALRRCSDRLRERNPSPYGFLINLGEAEYLVGASPEMYVRVEGDRVETCPISGTIARGRDPIDDAAQILALLTSDKDESELTMCTDVDRNDKSRICVPGSVRVIGRRQIEMYSRLIHTVDHVEGRLRPGFDALDAFLTHTWAVTVTGAPKTWAMQFIEDHERSPRAWYGGAVGVVGFDGSLNTGLTLRTIRVKDGVAEVRVGATLLYDSDPDAEERETELKASAFLDAVRAARGAGAAAGPRRRRARAPGGACCSSTTRTRSSTRWPTTCARRAPRSTRCARGFPADAFDDVQPRPGRALPGPGHAARLRRRGASLEALVRRTSPSSASASACRAWSSTSAARSACSTRPCTASRRAIRVRRAGGCSTGCPAEFTRGPLPLAVRAPRPACRPRWWSRPRATTAWSWPSSTRRCRWRPCSSTPSRS